MTKRKIILLGLIQLLGLIDLWSYQFACTIELTKNIVVTIIISFIYLYLGLFLVIDCWHILKLIDKYDDTTNKSLLNYLLYSFCRMWLLILTIFFIVEIVFWEFSIQIKIVLTILPMILGYFTHFMNRKADESWKEWEEDNKENKKE